MSRRLTHTTAGFTFIEVLVSMLIFVTAVAAAVGIIQGAVRATRDSKEMSVAAWLLQSKMVELETRLETLGFDRGCDKKKEGKFDAPFDTYRWSTECYEVDLKISETASNLQRAMSGDAEEDTSSQDDQIQKIVLNTVNDYMGKSLREIHVEVSWEQGKTPRSVSLTSHFARYDQPINIPNFAGVGGAGGG